MRISNLAVTLLIGLWLSLSPTSSAAANSIVLTPFTGDDVSVELTLSEQIDGTIRGDVLVAGGIGDLRGLFLDISDLSLLAGLAVTGADVTDFQTGSVIDLGQGNNLNGGGSPCRCDMGIAFGGPGIGQGDDIRSTTFYISHDSQDLTLALFDGQLVGARVTSVGEVGGLRTGSSKLVGVVPEPGTALLLGAGLLSLALRRRGREASPTP